MNSGYNLGLGVGLDKGVIGIQFQIKPVAPLVIFGYLGTALSGPGFGGGFKLRVPNIRFAPYILAMYGTNSSIYIKDLDRYNKVFKGPTYGIGLEIHRKRNLHNFFDIAVLLPIRPPEYDQMLQNVRKDPRVETYGEPGLVTLSFSYHFGGI